MTGISIPDLLTYIYVLVDDWYQAQGASCLKGKPGAKPVFSNSEVITLMVCMDFIPCPAETQFIEHIRSNYGSLFSRLLTQSWTSCWTPNRFPWLATSAASDFADSAALRQLEPEILRLQAGLFVDPGWPARRV